MLNALTFPFLRPIRKVMPPIGGTLDLSPLVVIVIASLLLMRLPSRGVVTARSSCPRCASSGEARIGEAHEVRDRRAFRRARADRCRPRRALVRRTATTARCAASCAVARKPRRRRARTAPRRRCAALVAQRDEARDGGFDLRHRPERARRHDEQALDAKRRLEHDGQPPVVRRAGRGGHARDDFLLQHHVHVAQMRACAASRNRSGELMLYGRLPTMRRSAPARKVEVERVGLVQRRGPRAGNCSRNRAARSRSISMAVDVTGARDQLPGQRARGPGRSRRRCRRLRRDRVDDAAHVVRVGEEILAESLARARWPFMANSRDGGRSTSRNRLQHDKSKL